ncbi:MAG TPA: hypothetical protein VFZ93_16015 [Albitalea sp.]
MPAALLAAAAAAAAAEPVTARAAEPALDTLKAAYLECDRRASQAVLDRATATQCSVVAEQLLQRGFEGDLDRLLDWWRRERTSQVPGATATS